MRATLARMRASNAASSSVSLSARFISWNQSIAALVEEARDRGVSGRGVALAPVAQQRLHREVQRAALRERGAQAAEQRRSSVRRLPKNSGASSAQ